VQVAIRRSLSARRDRHEDFHPKFFKNKNANSYSYFLAIRKMRQSKPIQIAEDRQVCKPGKISKAV